MYSGQEAFGCSTEWLVPQATSSNTSWSSGWVSQRSRWSPAVSLYAWHNLHWKAMDAALEDAQVCFQTSRLSSPQLQTHETWRDKILVVSPFLSNSDLWRPNAMGAGTMLEAALFDHRHLFKNKITSAWCLQSNGWLFSPTWNIPCWAYDKLTCTCFYILTSIG